MVMGGAALILSFPFAPRGRKYGPAPCTGPQGSHWGGCVMAKGTIWGLLHHPFGEDSWAGCSPPPRHCLAPTSADEADGTEQPRLGIVHLQRQQLVGEGEDEVGEGPEAGVVHLRAVQRQPVREGHGVLLRRVARADPQDLGGARARGSAWCPLPVPAHVPVPALTRMSRQAALRRVIWSAMVSVVKPGSCLANSTVLMMHLVDNSLNLSHRSMSRETLCSELLFCSGKRGG